MHEGNEILDRTLAQVVAGQFLSIGLDDRPELGAFVGETSLQYRALTPSRRADKPDVALDIPTDPNKASAVLNIRVADMKQAYNEWSAKGANFLTPPIDRGTEIRFYMRDPDGQLIEVGQATNVPT